MRHTGLELHLGSLVVIGALSGWYLKHRLAVETEHAGKEHGGESLHAIVELLGGAVEEAASGSQLVFHIRDFALELKEILVGLQFGISLHLHFKPGQSR